MLTAYEAWYRDGGLAGYAAVFAQNDEKDIEVDLITTRLDKDLQWPETEKISVLDIGCGTGRFTVQLLDLLCRKSNLGCQSEVDLVDINPDAFEYFRASSVNTKKVDIQVCLTINAPWRMVDAKDLQPPYRLIVADHVFYGEPFTEDLIKGLTALISLDGIIIVTLQKKTADIYSLREAAGVVTNNAEAFSTLLKEQNVSYETIDYQSCLFYDINSDVFREWFFATSGADLTTQCKLLHQYTFINEKGRSYLRNQGCIFIIRGERKIV